MLEEIHTIANTFVAIGVAAIVSCVTVILFYRLTKDQVANDEISSLVNFTIFVILLFSASNFFIFLMMIIGLLIPSVILFPASIILLLPGMGIFVIIVLLLSVKDLIHSLKTNAELSWLTRPPLASMFPINDPTNVLVIIKSVLASVGIYAVVATTMMVPVFLPRLLEMTAAVDQEPELVVTHPGIHEQVYYEP